MKLGVEGLCSNFFFVISEFIFVFLSVTPYLRGGSGLDICRYAFPVMIIESKTWLGRSNTLNELLMFFGGPLALEGALGGLKVLFVSL